MKSIIIANWKMNPENVKGAKLLFDSVNKEIKNLSKKPEIVICPPFIYLSDLQNIKSNIKLGSQDCFWEDKGSFTGEISCSMLKNFNSKYVIVGHSERRIFLAETDRNINRKIKAVLKQRLKPIFCIGETKREKDKGRAQTVLRKHIENGLKKIDRKELENIVLAYEPIWAIGSGKPCLPDEAKVMRFFLKKVVSQKYSRAIADKMRMVYGGSVNSQNVKSFIQEAGFNGVLVGGASLKPKEFIGIIKQI